MKEKNYFKEGEIKKIKSITKVYSLKNSNKCKIIMYKYLNEFVTIVGHEVDSNGEVGYFIKEDNMKNKFYHNWFI